MQAIKIKTLSSSEARKNFSNGLTILPSITTCYFSNEIKIDPIVEVQVLLTKKFPIL